MQRLNFFSFLNLRIVLLFQTFLSIRSLNCFNCIGFDCDTGVCQGDICFLSRYTPTWGSSASGPSRYIKGCLSNGSSIFRPLGRNYCGVSASIDGHQRLKSCYCTDRNWCNSQQNIGVTKFIKKSSVLCLCDHRDCEEKICTGDYCTIARDLRNGKIVRGCADSDSLALLPAPTGTCFRPPLGKATGGPGDAESLLKYESCLCTKHVCNTEFPSIPLSTTNPAKSCRMRLDADFKHGKDRSTKRLSCIGDVCYSIRHKASDEDILRGYSAAGCVRFWGGAKSPKKIEKNSCLHVVSSRVSFLHCFTSPRIITARKVLVGQGNRSRNPIPPPGPAVAPKNTMKSSERDETSNSKAVATFMLVIVLIFGFIFLWKLNLHQRFFRARYESVV